MKFILIFSFSFLLYSCSSNQTVHEKITAHLKNGTSYAEGDFDKKFYESKSDAMISRGIGIAEYSLTYNDEFIKKVAIFNSKIRLLESSATNMDSESNNQVGVSTSAENFFEQKDILKTALRNVKGIQVQEKDIECKTKIKPTIDGEYSYSRECRAIAQVATYVLKEVQKNYNIETASSSQEKK